jgi:hypothetical protein
MLRYCTALRFRLCALALLCASGGGYISTAQTPASTPTDVVRNFYTRLRERRFEEALMMSVYRLAVETLNAEELAELRPEFEALASTVPTKVEITGVQISGDTATVFMKLASAEKGKADIQPVMLVRVDGKWVIGDREAGDAVKRLGKTYFFELRIETHHTEAQAMMGRIAQAQLVYSLQHNGDYADMDTLIKERLLPVDILTTDSTGYRFRITPSADRKSFTAGAEPARYNRTGRFSFLVNPKGMQRKDTGGKPIEDSSANQYAGIFVE